jgi:predicted transcriptional regulator
MEYKIPVKKEDYYKSILTILNFNLGLSALEMDIIVTMLNNNTTTVNADSREIIRKVLDKSKFVTNNYIMRLKNKGVLIPSKTDKTLYINPNLVESVTDKKIAFEFETV